MQAFDKLTTVVDGEPRIISDPPLIVPVEELSPTARTGPRSTAMRELIAATARTLQPDRRHLLEQLPVRPPRPQGRRRRQRRHPRLDPAALGRDDGDPLFLQVKEAQPSVLEPFIGPSEYANHGERVVAGQRLMQAASDIFLGWER